MLVPSTLNCVFLYYRIGLVGNPSDGFYGKTIAMSITNFWAEVTITESEKLASFGKFIF